MKKIVFDFIRSPYKKIDQVKKGDAPKESLLGYCYLKSSDFPATTSNNDSKNSNFLDYYSLLYKLKAWKKADVVVITSRFSIFLALLSRSLGKDTVFYDSMQNLPKSELRRAKVRMAIYLAHKSVFFSENQLKQWQKVFPQLEKKGHSIFYGIDSDFFKPEMDKKDNICNDQYLSIGRDPNRDFQILAEAFQDKTKKLTLVTKEYLLNKQLKDNPSINILDELSYNELKIKYTNSHASIIPILPGTSHLSGIRAAMESMANKTLVIIARNKSLEEYFKDLEHVIFYEPGSCDSLLNAIELSKNKEIKDRLIYKSYILVTTKYTHINMVNSFISLIGSENEEDEKSFDSRQLR